MSKQMINSVTVIIFQDENFGVEQRIRIYD
jgi:hypothetical protein